MIVSALYRPLLLNGSPPSTALHSIYTVIHKNIIFSLPCQGDLKFAQNCQTQDSTCYVHLPKSILHAPYIVIFVEVSILMVKLSPSLPFPFVHLCHILSFLPLFFGGQLECLSESTEKYSPLLRNPAHRNTGRGELCVVIFIFYIILFG